MSQSLAQLYIHIIFHTRKSNNSTILPADQNKLYAYIGSIIKHLDSIPLAINSTDNHVHILCSLSKNLPLARLTQKIKQHSSKWLKGLSDHYINFSWQRGYAGFSVSSSLYKKTYKYINMQEEHHKILSIKDELILFLKEYEVDFDLRYLLED